MEEQAYDLRRAGRRFSVVGFAFAALLLAGTLGNLLLSYLPPLIWGENDPLTGSSWWKWIVGFAPMYVFAFPACYLILRRQPVSAPEKRPMTFGRFLQWLAVCFCMMYAGNLVGTVLSLLLSGGQAVNAIEGYAMDQSPLKVLVMVVLAPVSEELICRKVLIDRTRQYGEKNVVLLSGLVFGLLHQNLYQFFYAFALGSAFALIYLRTGRVRHCILLHMIINFNGAVIAPAVLEALDLETMMRMDAASMEVEQLMELLPGLMVYMGYSMVLMGLVVFGLVLILIKRRRLQWNETEEQLPRGTAFKTTWLNAGMILYTLLCLSGIVGALFLR